jgi:hypothetical protein
LKLATLQALEFVHVHKRIILTDAVTTAMFASMVTLKFENENITDTPTETTTESEDEYPNGTPARLEVSQEIKTTQYAMAALAFIVATCGGFTFGVFLGLVTALLTLITQRCRGNDIKEHLLGTFLYSNSGNLTKALRF